jgi:hypothetical protein
MCWENILSYLIRNQLESLGESMLKFGHDVLDTICHQPEWYRWLTTSTMLISGQVMKSWLNNCISCKMSQAATLEKRSTWMTTLPWIKLWISSSSTSLTPKKTLGSWISLIYCLSLSKFGRSLIIVLITQRTTIVVRMKAKVLIKVYLILLQTNARKLAAKESIDTGSIKRRNLLTRMHLLIIS